jgi:hypothetical protein
VVVEKLAACAPLKTGEETRAADEPAPATSVAQPVAAKEAASKSSLSKVVPLVTVAVAVGDGVEVGTGVEVAVAVVVGELVGMGVAVTVAVAVCVAVGVGLAVAVEVTVAIALGVEVLVGVGARTVMEPLMLESKLLE